MDRITLDKYSILKIYIRFEQKVDKYILSVELYIIFNSHFAHNAAEGIGDYAII